MVRKEGFEPSSLAAHAPQTCAYASSATSAKESTFYNANEKKASLTCVERGGAQGGSRRLRPIVAKQTLPLISKEPRGDTQAPRNRQRGG